MRPDKIILYGSFAKGDAKEWSDVDMLVVGDYKKKYELKIMNELSRLGSELDPRFLFDIRISRKNDFEKANKTSILNEIKKEGVVLYSR